MFDNCETETIDDKRQRNHDKQQRINCKIITEMIRHSPTKITIKLNKTQGKTSHRINKIKLVRAGVFYNTKTK